MKILKLCLKVKYITMRVSFLRLHVLKQTDCVIISLDYQGKRPRGYNMFIMRNRQSYTECYNNVATT